MDVLEPDDGAMAQRTSGKKPENGRFISRIGCAPPFSGPNVRHGNFVVATP
jgi:hypothetical protein